MICVHLLGHKLNHMVTFQMLVPAMYLIRTYIAILPGNKIFVIETAFDVVVYFLLQK